jgi:hypothetical protein
MASSSSSLATKSYACAYVAFLARIFSGYAESKIRTEDCMYVCRYGGVFVSVLATGPKGRGFEPGRGDVLLRAIKIRSTPSSRMGSKAGGTMS